MIDQNTKYDVDYFIAKFKAIPRKLWFTTHFANEMDHSQRCAFGHCGMSSWRTQGALTSEAHKLANLFGRTPKKKDSLWRKLFESGFYALVTINNGANPDYPQKHPRDRVLAALRDIKKKQEAA
jgi:hypothetical protein